MNRRLPIRWRLTLWYTLLSAIGLLLLGTALYFGLRTALFENFEEQVRSETGFALNAVSVTDSQLRIAPDGITQLDHDDHFVRLIDPSGQIVYQSETALQDIPLDQTSYRQALAGHSVYDVRPGNGEAIGIVSQPVENGGKIVGVLQIGSTRGDTEEVLRIILLGFLIAGPIMLLLAAAGGYLMAGRALAPVRQITELAATIDSDRSGCPPGARSPRRRAGPARPDLRCHASPHRTRIRRSNASSPPTPRTSCAPLSVSCAARSMLPCAGLVPRRNTSSPSKRWTAISTA